jgi:hypothetical protein
VRLLERAASQATQAQAAPKGTRADETAAAHSTQTQVSLSRAKPEVTGGVVGATQADGTETDTAECAAPPSPGGPPAGAARAVADYRKACALLQLLLQCGGGGGGGGGGGAAEAEAEAEGGAAVARADALGSSSMEWGGTHPYVRLLRDLKARLQPYVMEAAAPYGGGCNPVWWRLQPCVVEAATLCGGGRNPK